MTNEDKEGGETLPATMPTSALVAYTPGSFSEAKEMAAMFAESKAVKDITSPARAFLIMSTGAELGISPAASLRIFYAFGDRVGMSAQGKMGYCLRHRSVCKYFKQVKPASGEKEDETVTYETWRVGNDEPDRQTYTIQDAYKQFGPTFVDNPGGAWFKTRRRMLRWRCIGELADRVYGDLLLGIATIDDEERGDIIEMKPLDIGGGPLDPRSSSGGGAGGSVISQAASAVAAAAIAAGAAAATAKEKRKEERAAAATDDPRFAEWQERLDGAKTPGGVDAVAAEIQAAFKDGPDRERGKGMVKAAKERIKAAAAAARPVPENPIDKPAAEREPGSDG
jgi:hypothetical protein